MLSTLMCAVMRCELCLMEYEGQTEIILSGICFLGLGLSPFLACPLFYFRNVLASSPQGDGLNFTVIAVVCLQPHSSKDLMVLLLEEGSFEDFCRFPSL